MRARLDDRRLSVAALSLAALESANFALGIYSIGYEQRSRFIIEQLAAKTEKCIAIDLGGEGLASYDLSKDASRKRHDEEVPKAALELGRWSIKAQTPAVGEEIFVDISSMDRRTMSFVIQEILRAVGDGAATVHFLYAPAQFSSPSPHQLPLESSGPVNPLLGSYPREPRTPTVLVIGVGYEVGLALGVVETFEPARVYAYVPRGRDKRFDSAVDRVNAPLLMDRGFVSRTDYSISSPMAAFIDLKDRVFALREEARVILVPLGPKIFSSMCILLGYLCMPDIAVWRLSTQIEPQNAERKADGSIVGYTLHIAPADGVPGAAVASTPERSR